MLCVAALLGLRPRSTRPTIGQALLDKATDTKLSAENVADLNEVIKLCQEAIKAGLDEGNTKFANGLLASTLTQRAEMVCLELFERPVTPNRGPQAGANGAGRSGANARRSIPNQAEAQYLIGRLYAHLGDTKKAMKAPGRGRPPDRPTTRRPRPRP